MPRAAFGKVYLVGAGPGDPGLITARGLAVLETADVVLFDALVHPDLLLHCGDSTERVFVGKRAGRPHERQESITRRMIEAAQSGRCVVRLKGGDPYLFGRGSEEAEALFSAGVPFEVVPGVPSPMAAAAYAGISLTHRDLASSVAYVTASESIEKDESLHDWGKLATATQTLVIFMGMRKLDSLLARLVEHGRPSDTPAAVVEWASTARQRTVVGTIADIADKAKACGMGLPALTIIGPTVSLRRSLRWFDIKPLFGKRVLVTRPRHQSQSFAEKLRREGAEAVELPTIRIVPPADDGPLDAAIENAKHYDWIVFTSRNGVACFFEKLRTKGKDARALGDAKVCAIGPATASELERASIVVDLMPTEYRGEAVAKALIERRGSQHGHMRVLIPRAEVAREVLPETLREHGAEVDVVSAYRTEPVSTEIADEIRQAITQRHIDIVTFTSSSTVDNLCDILGDQASTLLAPLVVASIGPVTTERAVARGLRVDITASEYTTDGLVEALNAVASAAARG